ncbi:MAG: GNAT family N-acetyltransferase [Deltaproteobacteria bacterium]|nr:GNAT family N-acetyltransferase [Deltaproteobacteria bacterium]
MNDGITICAMDASMACTAWEWAAREGWNPGLEDHLLLPAIDPAGCLAMFSVEAGKPRMIGAITAVDYGGYGFVGMFLMDPAYRGQGYGKRLVARAVEHLAEVPNAGVDAVLSMVPTYEKLGLKRAYETVRYRLPEGATLKTVHARQLEAADIEALIAYDAAIFGIPRGAFLRRWVAAGHADAAVLLRNGAIVGYGVVRDAKSGRKVGPLFADDETAAADLLGWLLARKPDLHHALDLPSLPGHGRSLVTGATSDFACIRMYTGLAPRQDPARVFGNTTFEMG